ncbi:hypothetical protein IPJ91_01300 [bacterium]|nr:MAG: hypothetical protein IPJ91_01300 [bacterium]
MKISSLSKNTEKVIDGYINLNLGNKKVRCPYYINSKHTKMDLRTLVGKGNPNEIEDEVKIWAQIMKFDLNNSSESQIREFMQKFGIGVDCSGFVAHILNTELKSRGMKSLKHILKFQNNDVRAKFSRLLKEVEFISANTLTNESNSVKIRLDEVQPLDMIRLHSIIPGGFHIALVTKVENNEITYIHSSKFYLDENGVRYSKIRITNLGSEDLSDQEWVDVDKNGKNWIKEEYETNKEDSGFRRLKIFSN